METKPIVYVAALTYKRPDGIKELLSGLAALQRPEHWETRFLLVDNDPRGSAERAVAAASGELGDTVTYVIEPEPGIPAARNRALREAIEGGGTLLCFLDDDETPQRDWLVELISHWQRTGAYLIGGPLRRFVTGRPRSLLHRMFARSLVARRTLAERRAASVSAHGGPVPINTSNWMCDLRIVREHDLWFDEGMRVSGGSDAAFYRAARQRGLPLSWCPTAIVCEPIAQERLSIRYQFRRSRSQGIVMAELGGVTMFIILRQAVNALAGAALMIVPALGAASFAAGLHLVAFAAGHLAHMRGRASTLYSRNRSLA